MNSETNSFCRLCAFQKQSNKLLDLLRDDLKMSEMCKKLARINSIQNFEDSLPKTVCEQCIDAVDAAFELVNCIEEAQVRLRSIFGSKVKKEELLKVKEEDNDNHDDYEFSNIETNKLDKIEIHVIEPFVVETNKESNRTSSVDTITTKSNLYIEISPTDPSNVDETSPSELNKSKETPQADIKEKKFICTDCNRKFTTKGGLGIHRLSHIKLNKQSNNITWEHFKWTCYFCETQFATAKELQQHSMSFHKCCNAYGCTDCKLIKQLSLGKYISHVQTHKDSLRLSCYFCFKVFPKHSKVYYHKKVHYSSPHVCPGCHTSFETIEDMKEHITTYFVNKKVQENLQYTLTTEGVSCNICNEVFQSKDSFYTHFKLLHKERSHICDQCGEGFVSKAQLDNHLIRHLKVKPFQCTECNLSFAMMKHLRNHLGIHDGVKPFTCDQCGKCFRQPHTLEKHRLIHTDTLPEVCTHCNKRFLYKSNLTIHLRQHTGARPYSCHICSMMFTNWSNWNKHMKRRHSMNMAKRKILSRDPGSEA